MAKEVEKSDTTNFRLNTPPPRNIRVQVCVILYGHTLFCELYMPLQAFTLYPYLYRFTLLVSDAFCYCGEGTTLLIFIIQNPQEVSHLTKYMYNAV